MFLVFEGCGVKVPLRGSNTSDIIVTVTGCMLEPALDKRIEVAGF
jgi:hypothetical protein